MELKIISPLALWQDYNPTFEPLEITVNKARIEEKCISKDVSFTVENVSDGKIRARASLLLQKDDSEHPTILFLTGGESLLRRSKYIDEMLERGYNIVGVDFGGKAPKKDSYTIYPKSFEYCNYYANRDIVYEPTDARSSMWFVWMKVVRRAITMAFLEHNVDRKNLFLMGNLEGGQLAWKVAGIDGRIRAVLPVGAAGYTEYLNVPKYGGIQKIQFSDEWECYLAGLSTQAYARMLHCPVFYIMGTNSTYADIDRISDLFAHIPHEQKYKSFSAGANVSIDMDIFTGALNWIDNIVAGHKDFIHPETSIYVSEGKLYANVTNIGEDSKVEIYYATDEITPAFRQWAKCLKITALNGEVFTELLPNEEDEKIFVYANVIKDGIIFSTNEVMFDLTKVNLIEYNDTAVHLERIVYDSDMVDVPFTVENLSPVIDNTVLKIKRGPYGLNGFMTSEGRLCLYNVAPPTSDVIRPEDFILQLEAYSDTTRDIRIVMYTAENLNTKYTVKLHLNKSTRWQRFNLSILDFKTSERRTLKSWNLVKKMKIKDAENVLFTNILWI